MDDVRSGNDFKLYTFRCIRKRDILQHTAKELPVCIGGGENLKHDSRAGEVPISKFWGDEVRKR